MSDWSGDERRQSQRGLDEIYDRLNKGGERMDKMDAEIERNTKLTESIDANTRDLIALFRSWAGAFKTIEQIGSLARPVLMLLLLRLLLEATTPPPPAPVSPPGGYSNAPLNWRPFVPAKNRRRRREQQDLLFLGK